MSTWKHPEELTDEELIPLLSFYPIGDQLSHIVHAGTRCVRNTGVDAELAFDTAGSMFVRNKEHLLESKDPAGFAKDPMWSTLVEVGTGMSMHAEPYRTWLEHVIADRDKIFCEARAFYKEYMPFSGALNVLMPKFERELDLADDITTGRHLTPKAPGDSRVQLFDRGNYLTTTFLRKAIAVVRKKHRTAVKIVPVALWSVEPREGGRYHHLIPFVRNDAICDR